MGLSESLRLFIREGDKMKISVNVCPLWRREDCNGIIYNAEVTECYGSQKKTVRFCSNDDGYRNRNGRIVYHQVCGHGYEDDYDAIMELSDKDKVKAKEIIDGFLDSVEQQLYHHARGSINDPQIMPGMKDELGIKK